MAKALRRGRSFKAFAMIVDLNSFTRMVRADECGTAADDTRDALVGAIAAVEAEGGEVVALMGERRGVHYLRKFHPWYLTGEDVPQEVVADLLTLEDFDRVVAVLEQLADPRPLATTSGLN